MNKTNIKRWADQAGISIDASKFSNAPTQAQLAAFALMAAADSLAPFAPWLHAAYDCPPQTPEAAAMLAKLDASVAQSDECATAVTEAELQRAVGDAVERARSLGLTPLLCQSPNVAALPPELVELIQQAQSHMLRTPEADAVSVKLTQYLMNAGA